MKKWGQRMDSLHGEIKGLEKLVKYVYDMIAPRMEEAANDGDQATLTMLKRMQDKIMAICIPLVVSTQKSWEEFQMTMTVKITKQHLEFAKLMFEVLYACEDYLFGQTWQEHYENEERDIQPRITYRKTSEHFNELPSEFTTDMFMKIWGYSSNSTASTRIKGFVKDGKVEPIEGKRGYYKKLATAV